MQKLVYSQEEYEALDCDEYRRRFPSETDGLTDEQVFNVMAATEDDQSDDDWRKLFAAAQTGAVNAVSME